MRLASWCFLAPGAIGIACIFSDRCSARKRSPSGMKTLTCRAAMPSFCLAASPTETICAPALSLVSLRLWAVSGIRRPWRTGARHLQRLPDTAGSGSAARRHAAKRESGVSLPWTHLRVENVSTPFTELCSPGQVIRMPISHGEGNYFADDDAARRPGSERRRADSLL